MQSYNQTRHDHEITLERNSIVEVIPQEEAGNDIPSIQYHVRCIIYPDALVCLNAPFVISSAPLLQFRKVEEVENLPANTVIDVLGVVESVDALATITKACPNAFVFSLYMTLDRCLPLHVAANMT